jgi:Tol biopolymer transport system component
VIGADGRHARRLVRPSRGEEIVGLDWSPDGRSIAYAHGFLDNAQLVIVRASDGRRVRAWPRSHVIHPRWTRDGRGILYASSGFRQGTPYESSTEIHDQVFVADVDGKHVRRLSPTHAENDYPAAA